MTLKTVTPNRILSKVSIQGNYTSNLNLKMKTAGSKCWHLFSIFSPNSLDLEGSVPNTFIKLICVLLSRNVYNMFVLFCFGLVNSTLVFQSQVCSLQYHLPMGRTSTIFQLEETCQLCSFLEMNTRMIEGPGSGVVSKLNKKSRDLGLIPTCSQPIFLCFNISN